MSSDTRQYELITATRGVPGPHSRWSQDESLVSSTRGDAVPSGHVGRFHLGAGSVLLGVADGVGSVPDVEVPARQALQALMNEVRAGGSEDQPPGVLDRAFAAANRAVSPDNLTEEERQGLWNYGSTLTVAFVVGLHAWIAHLGDSRAYLVRRGRLYRLTRDHTVVELMVEEGHITAAEAREHQFKNVMIAALGARPDCLPSLSRVELEPGDRLALCTDGVTETVTDAGLAAAISGAADAKGACLNVINDALTSALTDNATILVTEIREIGTSTIADGEVEPVVTVIRDVLDEHVESARRMVQP